MLPVVLFLEKESLPPQLVGSKNLQKYFELGDDVDDDDDENSADGEAEKKQVSQREKQKTLAVQDGVRKAKKSSMGGKTKVRRGIQWHPVRGVGCPRGYRTVAGRPPCGRQPLNRP
jgi:hypothetical protein